MTLKQSDEAFEMHKREFYLKALENDRAYAKAEELGLDVVIPDEYTLTLDFDEPAVPQSFYSRLAIFQEQYDVDEVKTTVSRGGNTHVYVTTKQPFTKLEQVALQAILGSDAKREMLGFIRVNKNVGLPSLMFEKKKAPESVEDIPF